MPASGEERYYEAIGEAGRQHAINKPFSEERRGAVLMEVGAVCLLLPPPPCRVLECGCGTGWLSYVLAKSGYDVVGQDVSTPAIELARANPMFTSLQRAPTFVAGDFEQLAFVSEFEAVVFFDSLHHSTDMPRTVASAYRALKPGGTLVASEPGVGHEDASRDFAAKWNVTDKDAPPSLSIELGLNAGFRRGQAFPHARLFGDRVYGRGGGLGARVMNAAAASAQVLLARRNGITVLLK